jgi:hypothetical protein
MSARGCRSRLSGSRVSSTSPRSGSARRTVCPWTSVSMAMLVVLEAQSPAERTAFVLHEVLGLSYREVTSAVGGSEAACRQLTTRARRHVRGPRTKVHTRP